MRYHNVISWRKLSRMKKKEMAASLQALAWICISDAAYIVSILIKGQLDIINASMSLIVLCNSIMFAALLFCQSALYRADQEQ
jgi:hypothetical protein